jgi:hypothetical protein
MLCPNVVGVGSTAFYLAAFASDAETSITQLSAIKNVSGVANVF